MKSRKKRANRGAHYLHGYSEKEQKRLYKQARFLEHIVYQHIDFWKANRVIEIGCGVGAQTEILIERFPHLQVVGVDISKEQIKQAEIHLADEIAASRVFFEVADAGRLPYESNSFDGAFICWFLEHVREPVKILREARRVLKASSTIYLTEPMNAAFYVNPYSPKTLQYWFEHNDYQWSVGGDPFVGARLANYLIAAGFQNVSTQVLVDHYDNRAPKRRAEYIEYWTELLLSGAPRLLKSKRITPKMVKEVRKELERLKDDPDAVFFSVAVQAQAQAF